MGGLGFRCCLAAIAVAVVTALGGLVSTAPGAPPRPSGPALARAIQVQKQHRNRLLAVQDVVGTATGVDRHGKLAVKVYARRAGIAGIPKELDGLPVVVEATGEFFALARPSSRRPSPHRRSPLPRRPPLPHRSPWRWGPPPRRGPPADRDSRPSVAIVDPADGAVVSGEVEVTALAVDDNGVLAVHFFADDVPLGSDVDGSDGWSVGWDTSQLDDGQHLLTATATDTIGQTGSDTVSVVIDNEPGPYSPAGRPAPIGVSTGNENECSVGTIACRVKDLQGNVYALSNNHGRLALRQQRRRLRGDRQSDPGRAGRVRRDHGRRITAGSTDPK